MVRTRRVGRYRDEELYPKRMVLEWPNGRRQIAYRQELVPFHDLEPDDYLDTSDLQQYFDCSVRTIYRWMKEEDLEPDDFIGREHYFEKRTIVRWEKRQRPRRGRPSK